MYIPQKIDEIIQARKGRAARVKKEMERLESARQTVAAFQSFRCFAVQSGNQELSGKLNTIVVDRFLADCDETIAEMERLYKRFSRDHVHMSFVGKARQGKSLVMQQISGLDGSIIPSAAGEHCTGAKSVITNSDEPDVSAEITFYSKEDIVGIVNGYIEAIFGKSEPRIFSFSDIPALKNRKLDQRLDMRHASANSHWPHLQNYIIHFEDYKQELGDGEERKITVSSDKIESFVAQYNSKDPSIHYYKYLGVKEANIMCRFPAHDTCGKLVLVDTIGLGDTAIGVEEEMIRAIREDSDAIIYMLHPNTTGPVIDAEHYSIIENISKRISVDYAKEMLFWVINRDMSAGETIGKIISCLAERLEQERQRNAVPICKALDVNCMDTGEVHDRLLVPVMQQMSERLDTIDELLISRAQSMLNELYDSYQELSVQIQGVYSKSLSGDVKRSLKNSIKAVYYSWAKDLKDLTDARRSKRNDDNTLFLGEFQRMLKLVLTRIPSVELIEQYRNTHRGIENPKQSYEYITQYVRNRIIDDFLSLDATLDELTKELKQEIVHILADDDKGKMEHIVPYSDGMTPDEWLESLGRVAESGGFGRIAQAMTALRDFSMSVKGFFIYPVRDGLDPIEMSVKNAPPIDDLNHAESVHDILKGCMFEIQKGIQAGCKNYISFPNSALYAAARDFYDRSVFAVAPLDHLHANMEEMWTEFYEDHIADIWPAECASYANDSKLNKELDTIVKSVKNTCSKTSFQI